MNTSQQRNNHLQDFLRFHHDSTDATRRDCIHLQRSAKRIVDRFPSDGEPTKIQGLIYGDIQSGKTGLILATIAEAADRGYSRFIVLTTDSRDLYQQTYDRVREALDGFEVLGKDDVRAATNRQYQAPVVLVCSKNARHLPRALQFVKAGDWQKKTVAVIDDEADQASLNTRINDRQRRPPSTINQSIRDLRSYLNSNVFLQTTATPQALFLQDSADAFRPQFVELAVPGQAYNGGDFFFPSETTSFGNTRHIRLVDPNELPQLTEPQVIPESLALAITMFILGAAALRLQGLNEKFACLIHTSHRQQHHHMVYDKVVAFKPALASWLSHHGATAFGNAATWQRRIDEAYADLTRTFEKLPPLSTVLAEAARTIASTEPIEINARTGEGVRPNPARRQTIYVGGSKISRGVTIRNLLVTYYGRDATSPQMDTVLQHARMYGYRQRELPAVRLFMPPHLAARFQEIHRSDRAMRATVRRSRQLIPAIPITSRGVRATRTAVLNREHVYQSYFGGAQYFPSVPEYRCSEIRRQTAAIDKLLHPFAQSRKPYVVPVRFLKKLLSYRYSGGDTLTWKEPALRGVIKLLTADRRYADAGSIVIGNRKANIFRAQSRGFAAIAAVVPAGTGEPPYGVDPNKLSIFMFRLTGTRRLQGGWDGCAFWIPVIRFPDSMPAFTVNDT